MKIKSDCFEKLNDKEIINLQRMKLPIRISYFLKRIMAKIVDESKPYFEQKKIIADKYMNELGDIPPEKMKLFVSDLKEMWETEIDLLIEKQDVRIDDLPEMSVVQIEFFELFFDIKLETEK